MNGAQRDTRTHVVIDDRDFILDPEQDLAAVMSRIEDAARSGPAFVDISGGGGQVTSVLISARTRVVVALENSACALPEIAPEDFQDWEL